MFGRRKRIVSVPSFSMELQALMGEWVVYSIYSIQAEHYNHLEDENLSIKDFFQNKEFNIDISCENYSTLCDLQILKLGLSVPDCKYEDVKETIFINLPTLETPMINHFTMIAGSLLGDSEDIAFEVDFKCQPLFKALEKEGYVRLANEKYYWTENIRPVMEEYGFWPPKGYISPEQKYLKKIPRRYREALNECAERKDIISGTMILKQLPEVRSSHGVKEHHKLDPMLIMKLLYPHVWPDEKDPVVWRFPV